MRIALITAHYPPATIPCGIGDYTRCLREALESLGHQCLVITSVHCRSREKNVYPLALDWGFVDSLKVWRCFRYERPDAVFVQYTPEHYGYGLAIKLLPFIVRGTQRDTALVTTFHTLVGGRWVAKPYAVLLVAGSRGVISIHRELSDLLRRRLPWCTNKMREIPIGANIPEPAMERTAARQHLRRRLGLKGEAQILGTFGFPAPGKGMETLIHAMRYLKDSTATYLLCIGETREGDRAYRADLEGLAQRSGVADRIHWLGGVTAQEASNLLAGADAYVVPYDEGASLRRGTLMAGFRIGVPIITTTPRYPDPALNSGETVLAVPPRAPEALADGIRRCLADSRLRDRLRQGMAAVSARFDWLAIAAEHVEFIQQLGKPKKE